MNKDELYKQAKKIISNVLKKHNKDKKLVILLSFAFKIIYDQPDKLMIFLEQEKKVDDLFDFFNPFLS